MLAIVTDETAGVVAASPATPTTASTADLEMLLLPLAHNRACPHPRMGVLAPTSAAVLARRKAVAELKLGTFRHIGPDRRIGIAPRFTPAALGSRVRHGFMVYSGGRETPPGERHRLTQR